MTSTADGGETGEWAAWTNHTSTVAGLSYDLGRIRFIQIPSSGGYADTTIGEWFLDLQVPVTALDATGISGGKKLDANSRFSIFATTSATSQNPAQKDALVGSAFSMSETVAIPLGNIVDIYGTAYQAPTITSITLGACPSSPILLTNKAIDVIEPVSGVAQDTLTQVTFQYYYDSNSDGVENDGSTWTTIGNGARLKVGTWTNSWTTTSLPTGKYIIRTLVTDDQSNTTTSSTQSPIPVVAYFTNTCGVSTSLSGNVFEDPNYGGGVGRSKATSSGVSRSGARVELFTANSDFTITSFSQFATTDGSGNYSFTSLPGNRSYVVRVVNSSVSSSRSGYTSAQLPVQTYTTVYTNSTLSGVTDRVGGENPSLIDAGNASASQALTNLTTSTLTAQSIAYITAGSAAIANVDFGFNFDTIVNVNDSGQGSLRQFILNANALANTGLAQVGQTAGKEVSIFMISDGASHNGLRAGTPNQLTSGVAVINPATALPAITGADTTIDGTTQTSNVGNANNVTLGTGGTVGTDALTLSTLNGPEVMISDTANLAVGLQVSANNMTIKGLAVTGFGNTANNDSHANILLGAVTGLTLQQNVIGATATSFTTPASVSGGDNVRSLGATTITVQNNLIGFTAGNGIHIGTASTGWTISNNEIRGNAIGNLTLDGLRIGANYSGSAPSISQNLIIANQGTGFETAAALGAFTFQNNTVTGNGIGSGATEPSGIRLFGSSATVNKNVIFSNTGAGLHVGTGSASHTITTNSIYNNGGTTESPGVLLIGGSCTLSANTIRENYGAGVMVGSSSTQNTISQNSFYDNGTTGTPTGQIGIDLLSSGDNQSLGTAPFYTINDSGDGDAGGNNLLNFPVITSAVLQSGNLIVEGYSRPGATIEIFIADPDPSGFGEGFTYKATMVEGSASAPIDTDAGTGTYSGSINGLNQGTDNTAKFRFTITLPSGVAVGTQLTATATLAGSGTSEFSGLVTCRMIVSLSGTIFEDLNFGGGSGRNKTTSSGAGLSGARVELYTANSDFSTTVFDQFTTTDANGLYTFSALTAPGAFLIRVVNSTVPSSRSGYTSGLLPVQTFVTKYTNDAVVEVTDRVGGENPTLVDAGNGSAGQTMATLTSSSATPLTRVFVTSNTNNVSALDIGFNFDTIANTNNAGQGSLAQFIANANALSNSGLSQSGQTAGKEVSIFMISDGSAHNGLRAGTPNQLSGGVAVIGLTTILPNITGADTTIDGSTQTALVGNNNSGTLGTGGTVGTDSKALSSVNRPEILILNAGSLTYGLNVQANNTTIRNIAIYGFGSSANADDHANIQIGASAASALIYQNVIGTSATSFADPGASRSGGSNIRGLGGDNGIVENNLVGYAGGHGIFLKGTSTGWHIYNNEIRGNTISDTSLGGINIGAASIATISTNLIAANASAGIDLNGSDGGSTIQNNTVTANGVTASGAAATVTPGIRLSGNTSLTTVSKNVVYSNFGAGVMVVSSSTKNVISQNSMYSNGTIGTTPSAQIGIDLLSSGDSQNAGTSPFRTLNDSGDSDTGGNNLLNYPILSTAILDGGNLTLSGFSRPGAVIEVFIADPDASGFGEGKTYLVTLTEGSGADTDAGTGNYSGAINGIDQGSETGANKFTFVIAAPGGVANGTKLTATATLNSDSTSEFSGNVTVRPPGVNVSGYVYSDANHNSTKDSTENGTGLTLYAKIMASTSPSGPATQAVAADPSTGLYTLTGVSPGTYIIVLDDNNTLSDVTPTIPAGWTGTEMPDFKRTDVNVNTAIDLPDQNFGLFSGVTISGKVFKDTGTGGGTANNGVMDGTEGGIASVKMKLTDSSGGTVYAETTTDGNGNYSLTIPSSVTGGTELVVREVQPAGYISVGASVGNTSGTYNRATDAISFNYVANTVYTAVNFGDVPENMFLTDGDQAGLPGNVLFYQHSFTAGTAGSVTFTSTHVDTPSITGWSQVIYRDNNCNGQIDGADAVLTSAVTVTAGEKICLIVKVAIPEAAAYGAKDAVTLTASFSYSNASPALNSTHTRVDNATVGQGSAAGLTLVKAVDKATALPGENIVYTITYSNNSKEALSSVIIYDATPAFTTFVSAGNGTLPATLTAVNIASPALGATGQIQWTFTGTLAPGSTGTVTFTVAID